MHTILSRANAVLAYTLSILAGVTLCCFFSTVFNAYAANVTISTSGPLVKNLPDYSAARERNDLGYVNFDVQVDLAPLFNWNTKELFVFLTAEYETKNNKVNQVVIWDKIINRGENPVVDIKSSNPKYYFWDDGDGLKGHENITLTLTWNVIPNAGHLPFVVGQGSHSFSFPNEYTSSRLQ